MPSTRALVVSLHDVSPQTFAECRSIVAELEKLGVTRISLLVIPDHHHRGLLAADAEFCQWLRESENAGHEIVLHGYHHRRARGLGESARQRFTTRVYTADEGEFYDLNRDDARALVERGLGELRAAGLNPLGFIAPAWLLSAAAETALRDLDLEYTTRLARLTDLRSSRTWQSQSLVWSVRSHWRRALSLAWNATLFHRSRGRPLLRISIHPVDLQHAAIWQQVRALTISALAEREPLTYHAWIARQRTDQLSNSPDR